MRLRMAAVALMALLPLGACSANSDPARVAVSPTSTPTAEPTGETPPVVAPPAGTRWQGINGVVVAVPKSWDTTTDPCGWADGGAVRFLGPMSLTMRCPLVGTAGSVLQVASSDLAVLPPVRTLQNRTRPGGVEVRYGSVRCRASSVGPCTLTFAVPSADATFQISYRGPNPVAFVERLRDSVTRLRSGSTTVPVVVYGSSVTDAMTQLSRAGLVVSSPDVNFPHYVTGTRPAAGTVVEEGATVELTVGDG